MSLVIEVIG